LCVLGAASLFIACPLLRLWNSSMSGISPNQTGRTTRQV
jgi:hypothetical protein